MNNEKVEMGVLRKDQLSFFDSLGFKGDYRIRATHFALNFNLWRDSITKNASYWLTDTCDNKVYYFDVYDKTPKLAFAEERSYGILPTIRYSSIASKMKNIGAYHDENKSIYYKQGEYGEYPKTDVAYNSDPFLSPILNFWLHLGLLQKTGKYYTIDKNEKFEEEFSPYRLYEYKYDGKKYVKFKGNWFEVAPIEWIINEEYDLCIPKQLPLAGIQYNSKGNYTEFSKSNLKWYLDNFFSKEIIPIEDREKQETLETKEKEEKISLSIENEFNERAVLKRNTINEEYQIIIMLLDKLKILSFNKYLELKRRLDIIIDKSDNESFIIKNNEISLELNSEYSKEKVLQSLIEIEADIKLILNFKLYTKDDIEKNINSLINNVIENVENYKLNNLNEIDKISSLFFNNIDEFSLKKQIDIAENISLLYLIVIKKYNIDNKEIEKNIYILYLKRYIFTLIKELFEKDKIMIDNFMDLLNIKEDISLDEIIKIINNIELKNNKKIIFCR